MRKCSVDGWPLPSDRGTVGSRGLVCSRNILNNLSKHQHRMQLLNFDYLKPFIYYYSNDWA